MGNSCDSKGEERDSRSLRGALPDLSLVVMHITSPPRLLSRTSPICKRVGQFCLPRTPEEEQNQLSGLMECTKVTTIGNGEVRV